MKLLAEHAVFISHFHSENLVCPQRQGVVASRLSEWEGITQHDYSPSLCLHLWFPNAALVRSPATDRELAAVCSH